jgi:DNA-binding transcriptional ArsR family regulator
MSRSHSPGVLALIADRFKVLSEPARLAILQALMDGERTVSDLVEQTGLTQANVSRHLGLLTRQEFVRRRRDGMFVHYSLAGRDIERLCDIMCRRLDATAAGRSRVLESAPPALPARRRRTPRST